MLNIQSSPSEIEPGTIFKTLESVAGNPNVVAALQSESTTFSTAKLFNDPLLSLVSGKVPKEDTFMHEYSNSRVLPDGNFTAFIDAKSQAAILIHDTPDILAYTAYFYGNRNSVGERIAKAGNLMTRTAFRQDTVGLFNEALREAPIHLEYRIDKAKQTFTTPQKRVISLVDKPVTAELSTKPSAEILPELDIRLRFASTSSLKLRGEKVQLATVGDAATILRTTLYDTKNIAIPAQFSSVLSNLLTAVAELTPGKTMIGTAKVDILIPGTQAGSLETRITEPGMYTISYVIAADRNSVRIAIKESPEQTSRELVGLRINLKTRQVTFDNTDALATLRFKRVTGSL